MTRARLGKYGFMILGNAAPVQFAMGASAFFTHADRKRKTTNTTGKNNLKRNAG
jgi:hypothetical protein